MRRLAPVVCALAAALAAAGCTRHRPFVPPHYPDGAPGLQQMWSDILDAAKKDDRERVHDLLATTLLGDDEIRRLFGARGDALLPRYHQLMGTLINRGGIDLVGQVYDHKLDAVDAFPDDADENLTTAMVEPHPLWSARVRKSTDTKGLRYDAFLYVDGRWKTLNQLGKFVDVVK